MKKITKIIQRFPFLGFLGNRYLLVLLIFALWMLFLDNYSYLEHRVLDKEINELEENIRYYRNEIEKDSQRIQKLKNLNQIEKYAREKYFMKRQNEDIYLIEYEEEEQKKEQF